LLDRALDKGLVLNADVIISLAGVPLIGLRLSLALASIETMFEYGVWNDWREAQTELKAKKKEPVKVVNIVR
jgi:hypothetical protein